MFTVDVEDWYQTNDFNIPPNQWGDYESRVESSTRAILELLDRHNVKATFFVLGCVAERSPELVKEICAKGHEIGSHGGWHRMLTGMDRDTFRKDLLYSKNLLEGITQKECRMFRAPSWSIAASNRWVLEILEEEGFVCDSSIQPFKTPLSGMSKVPTRPFHPVIGGRKLNIIEFPSTVFEIGPLRIPFSGGFYLRFMPYGIIKRAFKKVSLKKHAMLYVHPWETDPLHPVIKGALHIKFIHYTNLNTTMQKLDKLLGSFNFITLEEAIRDKEYPEIKI